MAASPDRARRSTSARITSLVSVPTSFRRMPWRWIAPVLGAVVLFAVFPPVRCVRLGPDGRPAADADARPDVFDPAAFATEFWTQTLQPAAARAPELAPIVLAVRADPLAAAKQHGHKVGEGTTWYYFARGSGRVTAIERNRLLLEVDGASGTTVALRTGPVFGNAVRDGCGLLELNRVPGLAEFNAVSAELNHRVEQEVQPILRAGAEVGSRVTFAGCAEAPESARSSGPLLVFVPVQVEVGR